jgi:hypothetical protein
LLFLSVEIDILRLYLKLKASNNGSFGNEDATFILGQIQCLQELKAEWFAAMQHESTTWEN